MLYLLKYHFLQLQEVACPVEALCCKGGAYAWSGVYAAACSELKASLEDAEILRQWKRETCSIAEMVYGIACRNCAALCHRVSMTCSQGQSSDLAMRSLTRARHVSSPNMAAACDRKLGRGQKAIAEILSEAASQMCEATYFKTCRLPLRGSWRF